MTVALTGWGLAAALAAAFILFPPRPAQATPGIYSHQICAITGRVAAIDTVIIDGRGERVGWFAQPAAEALVVTIENLRPRDRGSLVHCPAALGRQEMILHIHQERAARALIGDCFAGAYTPGILGYRPLPPGPAALPANILVRLEPHQGATCR